MKETPISLPESAREYLDTVMGKEAFLSVMMKDGRRLRVSYRLAPRYGCKGTLIPEDYSICPDCGEWIGGNVI